MKVWQAAALILIPSLALVLAMAGANHERNASAGTGTTSAGVDLDTFNNYADSLGTIETCLQVLPGSTMSIHTWVNGIPANRTLAGFSYNLNFGAGATINSHGHEYLLAVKPGSNVLDVSEAAPDSASPHTVGALETAGYPPTGEVGGVLGAYSIAIAPDASGYIVLNLDLFALSDSSAEEIPATTFGAALAVAPLTCAGVTPEVTPPITPTISATNCVTWTATPTVSPTPDPTPPWMPRLGRLICNDTGRAVSDLHVLIATSSPGTAAVASAPGCPEVLVAYVSGVPPGYAGINFDWGTPCVDPGEWVSVGFVLDCTTPTAGCTKPAVVCSYWTLVGQPVTPASPAPVGVGVCPSPSPFPTLTPTPTAPVSPTPPCPAGPDPSGGCLPCPTAIVYARGAAVLSTCPPILTPTPSPSPSPTPFIDIQGDGTCNGTVDASDALAVLRFGAGLAVILPPPCEGFDGDVDCSLTTNAVDALKILRHNAGLSVSQNEPCPDIGTPE